MINKKRRMNTKAAILFYSRACEYFSEILHEMIADFYSWYRMIKLFMHVKYNLKACISF